MTEQITLEQALKLFSFCQADGSIWRIKHVYSSMSSIWTGINAITQIETSTRGTTAAKGRAQFARGTFGAGAQISKKAFAVARDLVNA